MSNYAPHPPTIVSDIRKAIINDKVNACPVAVRLAWHASGTWDKNDNTGGSDGATMRFKEEYSDGANAGLLVAQGLLKPVKEAHPNVSYADIWTLAGAAAVQFTGGPEVPHKIGRTDKPDGSYCPPQGRLPDAAQGAQHLRDVFYRQGFDDREIVVLSGAHTLGRCHISRSGFDGPWTRHPLKFDNQYFKNLINLKWVPREWDGPLQYTDEETKELMMLPTDLCLTTDEKFAPWVKIYAEDEQRFFNDFAEAFARLISNGCANADPKAPAPAVSEKDAASEAFREAAMHGSHHVMKAHADKADVHAVEAYSGRSALHKAAFWGHPEAVSYLLSLKVDVNLQDSAGDTALHDACRFGHESVVSALLDAGADASLQNKLGQDAAGVASAYQQDAILAMLNKHKSNL
jgi:catalase (peroxidase I)